MTIALHTSPDMEWNQTKSGKFAKILSIWPAVKVTIAFSFTARQGKDAIC